MKKFILLFVLAFPIFVFGQESISGCTEKYYPIKPAVQANLLTPNAGGITFYKILPNTTADIKAKEGFRVNVGIQFYDIDCVTKAGNSCKPYTEIDLSTLEDFEVIFSVSSASASFSSTADLPTVTKNIRLLKFDFFKENGQNIPNYYYKTYESLATTVYFKNNWVIDKESIIITIEVRDKSSDINLRDIPLIKKHKVVYNNAISPTFVKLDPSSSPDKNDTWYDLIPKPNICFQYYVGPDIAPIGFSDYEGHIITEKCNSVTSGNYFSTNDINPLWYGTLPTNTTVDEIASTIFFDFYQNQVSNSWVIDSEDFFPTQDCHGANISPITNLIQNHFTQNAINENKVGLIINQKFLSGNSTVLSSNELHRKEINITNSTFKSKKKHL